jgi:WD40 repeat protein
MNNTYELNGATGAFIRKFLGYAVDNTVSSFNLSKDGKYFTASHAYTNILEYQTDDIKRRFTYLSSSSVFLSDSKRVLVGGALHDSLERDSCELLVYNMETREKTYLKADVSFFTRFAASSDGRYFVTAGIYGSDKPHTPQGSKITLWDAVTLQPIRKVFDKDSSVFDFRSIKFSNDNNYLAVDDCPRGVKIYNLIDSTLFKHIKVTDKPKSGVCDFCFIGNDLMALTGAAYDSTDFTEIINFKTSEVLYHTNEFGSYGSQLAYNPVYNSLIVSNTKYGHIALDMNKLVTVAPGTGSQPVLNLTYQNGIIEIDNIFTGLNMLTVKVINLQGQTIHNTQIDPFQYPAGLQIPVVLSSGSYIVQIIDGSKDYSGKMLVIN